MAEPPGEEPPEGLEREGAQESPKAEEEREASQYAYTNLAPPQEEELLEEEFAPQLEAIDADPSRALSEVSLDEITSPTEALVALEGEKVLLESATPLRAPSVDGALSKVDLGLEETTEGYSPTNPLVDVSLPKSAADPIGIGDGLTITAQGGSPNSAARLLDAEDLFLPEAEEDTSLLLSPISGGLELSAMLASRESPEQFTFAATLPQGAELHASEDGGAEVVGAEDEVLYRITAARAIDAQGRNIPVTLKVEGDSIVVGVAHREMEVAYPLYVDPEVIEESQWGFADPNKLNYWNWQIGGPTGSEFIGQRSPIVDNWGNGLYIRSRANITYGAGSFGRWWFSPPGSTTYFHRVIFDPVHYDAHGCAANEPHGYAGIWNNGGFWSALLTAYPSGWGTGFDNGQNNFGPGARTAFLGMEAASATNIKCGHDYSLNGATFYLDDPENPTVGAPSGVPTKWVNLTTPFTINVPVSDPGLGVKSAKLSPAGFAEHSQELGCSGLVANPCPPGQNFGFSLSGASFAEGETSARISAKDALEKTSNTEEVKLKVDDTPPELRLEGQLAKATDEEGGKKAEEEDPTKFDALSLPVYNLEIKATDGSNESAATKRSGVKSIEVFLDKSEVPVKTWTEPSCPASSCPLSESYALKLNELSAETHHTLRIVARDFAENKPREREITFEYIPATGMKEEYVLQHFPLPDGQGSEAEEEDPVSPELAVNVVNGNLVFHQQDVNVEGPAANLEVERYYNSLLPSSQNTEWGDGWTLAQTPTLEADKPESGPPTEATVVEESGAVESAVALPTAVGESHFNKDLQAVITKEPSGGYAVTDESGQGEGTLDFNESGETTELQTTEFAGVQYSYASGQLAEIAVDDPASADGVTPSQPPESLVSPTPTYSSAFGSSGTGNGQFAHPGDVAVDSKGNLWIADEENSRLQEFNEKGEFLKTLGSKGTGNGQFTRPKSIAFAANGNFWVADSGNSRLEQFNEKGEFVKAVGSSGSANGLFTGPEGLAIDTKGNIWVADTYNHRVQELNEKGEFIKVVNPTGLGAIEPTGLDVGPGGNVWVADWAHNRVVELSESGGLVRSFGAAGAGNGQFAQPDSVTVDTKGDVFVGDQNNGRVQEFNQSGEYVTQFGTKGTGTGQFSFGYPTGIAVDSKGDIWVTDTGNNRIQKWVIPSYAPTYSSAFGSSGTGNGQFAHPADVAIDAKGHLWVADENNHRIEEFNGAGEYMASVGSSGTGNGQFTRPKSIAFAANGNFWVADSGNSRLEQFNEKGEFLKAVGSVGSGNGLFNGPESIAIDSKGNIWVADTYNYRVQELNEKGEFIKVVNPTGLGAIEPTGLDVGPGGNVWVADWAHNRVVEFSESGGLVRSFGSEGIGNGQFAHPDSITVEGTGGVWVGDQNNGRVQEFNQSGEYVTQFGTKGTGTGEFSFSYPLGIAADNNGRLWIADTSNNRVQRWSTPLSSLEKWEAEVAAEIENPSIDVNVASGLVQSVKGKEVGEVSYRHTGESLTGVSAPEGETTYKYDGAGRMTKVTLPHGTFAEIAYEPTYGRVSSVTVSIEGAKAKTTHFEYTDEPRKTKVVPDGEVATTYEIGPDGSVFKWSNAKQPPVFDSIAGTLHDPEDLETANPISAGAHNLIVQAHATEGIASIQVVANDDQIVNEVTCEKSRTECETEKLQWVTETGDWPPGIVYLEVIATDQIGQMASERFWVNIPYTPPPDAETPQPAKFSEIFKFREEFGLDLDLKGNESAIDERIFDLMGDWNNPNTPAGEVARASWERWGVPLRVVDVAELEYRDWFYNVDAERIDQWVKETEPPSFAGYYIDYAAGGIIYIGFLDNQAERLASLEASLSLVARERLRVYPVTPTASYLSVQAASQSVSEVIESNSTLNELVFSVEDNEAGRAAHVMTQDVVQVENILHQVLGPSAPITVEYDAGDGGPLSGRFRDEGRMRAGDFITSRFYVEHSGGSKEYVAPQDCTAGFGVKDKAGEVRGHAVWELFVLTAGHCSSGPLTAVYRSTDPDSRHEDKWKEVGVVTRRGLGWNERVHTDAEAIEVHSPGIVPEASFGTAITGPVVTRPAARARNGEVVCYSGAKSRVSACGVVVGRTAGWSPGKNEIVRGGYWVKFSQPPIKGDSGGPVWDLFSDASIGLVTARRTKNGVNETLVEPLLHPSHLPSTAVPGILKNPHLRPLSLKLRN